MSNIMWVDDNRNLVGNWIHAFELLGHNVFFATDSESSFKIAAEVGSTIDLAFFDLLMPDMGGRTLAKQLKEKLPNARQALVTSYSKVDIEPDVPGDAELRVIDRSDLPLPGNPEAIENFLDNLLQEHDLFPRDTNENSEKRRVRDVTYQEYCNETLDGRSALNEEALKDPEVASIVREGGHYWVLVCGDHIETADTPKDVLPNTKVCDLARRIGRAPFQYFADIDVDDCSPKFCDTDLHGYPFVRMQLGASDCLDVHFDTGNSENFLNFDSIERFIDQNRLTSAKIRVRGETFKSWRGTLDQVIFQRPVGPSSEAFQEIDIIVIKSWFETFLVKDRKCAIGQCQNKSDVAYGGEHCYYRRHGLLGRRLQQCTDRYFVISPENAQVSLISKADFDAAFGRTDPDDVYFLESFR